MEPLGSLLAVIPARGGSKRLPRKNLRPFRGQPIIQYSIEAARAANLFDEIMVSTDDDEIAALAERLGARVPFRRSARAADDFASTEDVLLEVIAAYAAAGRRFDYICCLYPTAPFINAAKLREAWQLLSASGAEAVVPVTRFGFPIWRSLAIQNGRLVFNWPEHKDRRSQDLPPAFHDCGQFYFLQAASFRERQTLFPPHTVPLVVETTEAQDIDTLEDWQLAEIKHARAAAPSTGWADDDARTAAFFDDLVARHGVDHRAVNWGSRASQAARFEVLTAVAGPDGLAGASVLDVGCGVGDLRQWLNDRRLDVAYTGVDLAPGMVEVARARFPGDRFLCASVLDLPSSLAAQYDYVLASGIFFLRQTEPEAFVREATGQMFARARRALAFNSLSAWGTTRDLGEYYADPAATLEGCRALTPWATLRHDYHPADFTVYLYRERPA
jgi:pseudaminic acid cytidylyltransferase